MSEAPKKIWVDGHDNISYEKVVSNDVEYIRADLVDSLVEALRAYVSDDWRGQEAEIEAQARAALKSLEETNGN